MLKNKAISTNGNGHLPKASDFTLPKKLDKKAKQLIETGRAVMDELKKAREKRERV